MEQQYDLLGVGAGIFNLSLAALLSDNKSVTSHFLDKNTDLEWYPGLMLDNAKMQTCCIKDLVSLANPVNRYSFLNYLSSKV
ncbi:SidA/IucD/PvdA family monooxygenase [Zooshikella ganghwensis]|uniref:SidA/IucD/PvdA family monooxygenase n=1 Tax=Zooshikella ganghwensis TaxID=202772 RepID=UPI000406B479|nr:SidA/IucD/PvdA family monooxygenase [Zooshikella ganghwensis]